MSQSEELVDRIVAEVMAQLQRSPGNESSSPAPDQNTAPDNAKPTGAIQISDAVITGTLLEERGIAAGPIVLAPKSVLTPSAVEFLSSRKIGWSRGTASTQSSSRVKWLALVTRSTPAVTAALDAVAGGSACDWSRELLGCHREAAQRSVAALCRGETDGVVAITGKPEALACLANRNTAVRAAAIATVARIKALKQGLCPNLFAIDPTGRTEFELRSCFREIGSGAKPAAPAEWKE
jgi:hypothetical protein